jgi:hypothetical protein
MRIAVIALRNAADARMNTSSVIRLSHSNLSRSVMGGLKNSKAKNAQAKMLLKIKKTKKLKKRKN